MPAIELLKAGYVEEVNTEKFTGVLIERPGKVPVKALEESANEILLGHSRGTSMSLTMLDGSKVMIGPSCKPGFMPRRDRLRRGREALVPLMQDAQTVFLVTAKK